MLHSCGAPRAFHTRAVYTRPSGATVRVSTTCEYAAPQVTVSEMIEVRTYGYSIYSSIRNSRGCASFAQPKVEAYLYTVYTAVERWSLQRSGPDDCLALACGRGVRVSDYARVAPRHPRPRTGTRHPAAAAARNRALQLVAWHVAARPQWAQSVCIRTCLLPALRPTRSSSI